MSEWNILLVDDVLLNRRILRTALSILPGVRFFEASDGFAAMAALRSHAIDLVILDLVMPGKAGFEVMQEMQSDGLYCQIPIIVYSAVSDVDSINRAMELGAYDYFVKPLNAEHLRVMLPEKVQEAFRKNRSRRWEEGRISFAPRELKGIIGGEELHAGQQMQERKHELNELFRRIVDMDKEELYECLSQILVREMRMVRGESERWRQQVIETHGWSLNPDEIWEIQWESGEVYAVKDIGREGEEEKKAQDGKKG